MSEHSGGSGSIAPIRGPYPWIDNISLLLARNERVLFYGRRNTFRQAENMDAGFCSDEHVHKNPDEHVNSWGSHFLRHHGVIPTRIS
jgi:hypothetical protein